MILHLTRIALRIVEHRTVSRNPGNPVVGEVKSREIIHSFGLDAGGSKIRLCLHPLLFQGNEMLVQNNRDQRKRRRQNQNH